MPFRRVFLIAFAMMTIGIFLIFIGPLIANSFTLMIAGVLLFLVSLLMVGLFLFSLNRERDTQLSGKGVTVEGEVIGWESQRTPNGLHRMVSPLAGFITYRFSIDSADHGKQVITHTDNVWVWVQRRYPVGSRIPIHYLPNEPTNCQIA